MQVIDLARLFLFVYIDDCFVPRWRLIKWPYTNTAHFTRCYRCLSFVWASASWRGTLPMLRSVKRRLSKSKKQEQPVPANPLTNGRPRRQNPLLLRVLRVLWWSPNPKVIAAWWLRPNAAQWSRPPTHLLHGPLLGKLPSCTVRTTHWI